MVSDRAAIDAARRADATDPLRHLIEAFHPTADTPGYRTVYLDGHSLGLQPGGVERLVVRELRRWRDEGVGGWNARWLRVGDELAARIAEIVGAAPEGVSVGDSITIKLHQAVGAALAARPERPDVVMERGAFPTDRYAVEQRCRAAGGRLRLVDPVPSAADVAAACDERVGLVALGAVDFRTGALLDLPEITAAAQAAGAWMLWDAAHAAGVVPLGLDRLGCELAVGCTYKYLSGGPGAPAWLACRADLVDDLDPFMRGWFGHRDPFAMDDEFHPAPGPARFATGTPPVLSAVAALAGCELVRAAGIEEVADKARSLGELAIELIDAWLVPLGFELVSPREAQRRGGHVALRHEAAWPITQMLNQRLGVLCDHRPPDLIRFGLAPLPLRHRDVIEAMRRCRDAVERGEHRRYPTERRGVT